jgi:signal peptidase I
MTDNIIEEKNDEETDIEQNDNKKNNKQENKAVKIAKKIFFDWIVPVGIALVIAILINKFLIFKVEIPSRSMVPTLNVDDQLFATKVYNPENLKTGDIVIFYFKPKDELFIKRLIGLPGDKVEIKSGKVFVNDEQINEDYVKHPEVTQGVYNVPEGKYFFLGDNRIESDDARKWQNEYGFTYIDASDIKGKALIKVYPFSDFGIVK